MTPVDLTTPREKIALQRANDILPLWTGALEEFMILPADQKDPAVRVMLAEINDVLRIARILPVSYEWFPKESRIQLNLQSGRAWAQIRK
jgi:hypothetical protein